MRYGTWSIAELLARWRSIVLREGRWQPCEYEGYRPLAVDITAFWRPHLKGWVGRFFYRLAKRAIKGVGFGVVTQVGRVDGQRIPLLKRIIRVKAPEMSEAELKASIMSQVTTYLEEGEVWVHDAGVELADVQAAGIPLYILRQAVNATGRRNYLPPPKKHGRRAEYGQKVRPLPRQRLGKKIAGTAADVTIHFQYQGRTIEAQGWSNLVRSELKVAEATACFSLWAFFDPLYQKPMLLATNLEAEAETVYRLYRDRWPVEQPPLVAKQMLGLHRQFVFANLSVFRLPELGLLVANILTYLAAVLPPIPTGFWDRHPRRTSGRLRRVLARAVFPNDYPFSDRLREKQSVTNHLPKGILGHRRQKRQKMAT